MKHKTFFAADLGATSGRTILGTIADGNIRIEELTRFPNRLITTAAHTYWDVFALYNEILRGLQTAAQQGREIDGIGIDTWGCDFTLIGEDGEPLRNPMSYRDPCTAGIQADYFKNVRPRGDVYRRTGIQLLDINSLFQLYALRREGNSALAAARNVLLMPDTLIYMLTGRMICEYTITSTSQLLNPITHDLDDDLLRSVGLNRNQFGAMTQPATIVGPLSEHVRRLTGMGSVPVIAVAGHDTASAVAAVPAVDEHFAFLSSGTWSLIGIETPHPIITDDSSRMNFTNEGGVEGTTRFLKNICGLWLYERVRAEHPTLKGRSHADLQAEAASLPPSLSLINPDDPCFANPRNMTAAIDNYCRAHDLPIPRGHAALFRCIFDSLAARYREVFDQLRAFAPFDINTLHVVGGGSMNAFLNQLSADALGIDVLAGPQEATAMGNILLQAKAVGEVSDIWQMRDIVRRSIELRRFQPHQRVHPD